MTTRDRQPAAEDASNRQQRESDFSAALLAMAGHDLRQPLQVILSALSWLSRRGMQDCELEYIRRGEDAVARLVEHLDHLIEALRLHEHVPDMILKPVQVGPLIAAVCRDLTNFAEQKNVTLRSSVAKVEVMSDALLLERALHNLVRNALKYTPSGGKVLVGCRRYGETARIEVHDTGIGIPKDHLLKVFDAFHRVHSTRADGLGLGLFIVRKTIEFLGHRVDVRSTEGCGTCFSILCVTSDFRKYAHPDGIHRCVQPSKVLPPCSYLPDVSSRLFSSVPDQRSLVTR